MPDNKIEMTKEALVDMIQAAVTAAVSEMKKPTPEEAARLAKEKAERERRMQEMLQVAREEEEGDRRRKANCGHQKPNGRWATSGQITNDSMVTQICVRCGQIWKRSPTAEMMSGDFEFNGCPPPVQ